jgi:hypothetical protein
MSACNASVGQEICRDGTCTADAMPTDQPAGGTDPDPGCGESGVCPICTVHGDCAESQVCLPSRVCASQGEVAYVDPNGTDNQMCTKVEPCTRIASALATHRRYVKLRGLIDEAVTIGTGHVTLLAEPGTVLTRTMAGGPVLVIEGNGTVVEIYGLTIADVADRRTIGISIASGASAVLFGLTMSNNAGLAIRVNGGDLKIAGSNLRKNAGGGIEVIGEGVTFDIVANIFVANGTEDSSLGGLRIQTTKETTQESHRRADFNSFSRNRSLAGVGAAIQCSAGTFVLQNNVLCENGSPPNEENQVSGACGHAYTGFWPSMPVGDGMGNFNADPKFQDAAAGNLRLAPGSPAIGAANPNSDLRGAAATDFDGTPRPTHPSVGAFEPRQQ